MTQTQQWSLKTAAQIDETDYAQWQQLVDEYHQGNPILSAQFVKLLLEFFCSDYYLTSCIEGDATKCMLLIQKRKFGIWQVVQPSQAPLALIVGHTNFTPSFSALLQKLPNLAFRLDFICLDPLEHGQLLELLKNHAVVHSMKNIRVAAEQDFDVYWAERSKNLRKNIKRYQHRIESDQKALRFIVYTDPLAMSSAVGRYGLLESKGWKGKNGTALHPSNSQGVFYQTYLATCDQSNSTPFVMELYLNEDLIASRLCCFNENIFTILKTAYDEDFKNYAPGRLLLAEVIKYVLDKKISKTIDFYTNATEEQIDWASDVRTMYKASYYKNSIIKNLTATISHIKRKIL